MARNGRRVPMPIVALGAGTQHSAVLEWGLRVRWVFLAALALGGTLYGWWIRASGRVFLLWVLFLLGQVGLNLTHAYLVRRHKASLGLPKVSPRQERVSAGSRVGNPLRQPVWISILTAVDLIVITGVIYLTGGPHSPVGWLFAAPIMLVSLIGGWRAGVPVAAASWLLYTGLLIAEASGWLPHLHPEPIAIGSPPPEGHLPRIATPLLSQTAVMGMAVSLCSWFHANLVAGSRALWAALQTVQLQAAALESADDGVLITDPEGRIQWVNPAFTRLTGYSAQEVIGRTPAILHSGKQDDAFYRRFWETIKAGRSWRGELINRRKDGSLYVEEQRVTAVRGPDGEITHFIAFKQDVTERKKQEEQLRHLATHDPLTNLPNRRMLQEALEKAIARARLNQKSVLMFLDVDNLKMVNDTLGHAAGDQVLLTLVDRFRSVLREGDLLGRLAGDEFVVLLENTDLAQAARVAQRLREVAGEMPVDIGERLVYVTVSIGLVAIDGSQTAEAILSWADAAMYEAKLQGRNQVVVRPAEAEDWARLNEHWAWVQRFKHALDDNRFLFHYQPIVRLADGKVAGYEALLRLQDEEGQLISPGEFLPVAEQAGRMRQVDEWVIENVVRVLREHPDVFLSVNLSGQALNDEDLIDSLLEQLRSLGSHPPRLGIEITETMVIRDFPMARRCIERLRAAGCKIYLDDFGSGFNSFAYLRHLSADVLKIDGTLIRDLKDNPQHQAMVRAIKVLADGFNLETVAEFVDDEETARMLREFGITYGQGYYFSKPGAGLGALGGGLHGQRLPMEGHEGASG